MHPRERLAQFEDEKLGKDAPRQNGEVERGHGSRFQKLGDDDRRKYLALERLLEAQNAVEAAESALTSARLRLVEAEKKAGVAPEQPPAPEPAPVTAAEQETPTNAPDVSQERAAEPRRNRSRARNDADPAGSGRD